MPIPPKKNTPVGNRGDKNGFFISLGKQIEKLYKKIGKKLKCQYFKLSAAVALMFFFATLHPIGTMI